MLGLLNRSIEKWLSRKVPVKGIQNCFEIPVVLSTDIGLRRSQNQDRVAMIRIGPLGSGRSSSMVAVAVADGMGGMQHGDQCANLAVSNFFNALVRYRNFNLSSRLKMSIGEANDAVNKFVAGKGGATLTVVAVDGNGRAVIAHVGDTRVYAFGGGAKTSRLTIDDSLEEVVGGHGRDLLQFVGMGEGISPHLIDIPLDSVNLAITTDGVHYVASSTLDAVLYNAPDVKAAAERMAALAKWCGSPDNASSAVMELSSIKSFAFDADENDLELWDAFGHTSFSEIRVEYGIRESLHDSAGKVESQSSPDVSGDGKGSRKSRKARTVGSKKTAVDKNDLNVEINISSASEGGDDRRE
ncbi:MAG: PP2C family protein-serine/threonine phosphatase [Pseudomonas putida]|uniref:PP2C family protein-serine/threonine phosphatase n=1 Tax=Pseudomonas putida TaxID=303 RepID=UPI0022B568C3|nr:protein phosphatase 2C domain-containing protein [Pseudomonas putida]